MNIFEEVKARVKIAQVVEFYGYTIKRNNFVCPFHNDTRPSAFIKNDYFNCFVCGAGGDVITFTAKLFGLSNYEACKKLIQDFCLPISINEPLSAKERLQAERSRQKALKQKKDREELEKLVHHTGIVLAEYHQYLWLHRNEDIGRQYLTQAQYMLSCYDEDQEGYSIKRRKDVSKCERIVLRWHEQNE